MKLRDLKTTMVVKLRNDSMFRVIRKAKLGDLLIGRNKCINLLDSEEEKTLGYSNNLLHKIFGTRSRTFRHPLDIMKIYEVRDYEGLITFKLNHLDLIYSRIE